MVEKVNSNVKKLWKKVERFYEDLEVGININPCQPGGGKTYGFVQHVKKNPNRKIIFFSSNHEHLKRIKNKIRYENLIHWEGFSRKCPRYPKEKDKHKWTPDQKLVYEIYNKFTTGVKILCSTCIFEEHCQYRKQFSKKYNIVLSPLEFIYRSDIKDRFDEIWVDESVRKFTTYNWDFSKNKFKNFIRSLDEIPEWKKQPILNEYHVLFNKINKELLKNTSIIFKRQKEELINFNDKSFSSNDWVNKGFLQNREYITHIEKMNLTSLLLRLKKNKEHGSHITDRENHLIINREVRNKISRVLFSTLRKAVQKNQINNIIESYIHLEYYLYFIDLLLHETSDRGAIIVNEKIEIIDNPSIVESKVILVETKDFEKGFIRDDPYFLNKKTNRYLISRIGIEYSSDKKKLEHKNSSRFSVGIPLILEFFKLAESKPVILMDASFNKNIFNEHLKRYVTRELLDGNISKINKRYLETEGLINKKSIVYRILLPDGRKSDYPITTLRDYTSISGAKWEGSYKRIYSELKKNILLLKKIKNMKIGVISKLEYENDFIKIFGKKLTNHFFNQRGTNRFKKVDCLIVLGTPYLPHYQYIFQFVLNFGMIPDDVRVKTENNRFGGFYNPLMQEILKVEVYDELYQGIHRCRPLLYDKKIILYGKIPVEIKKELTIKTCKIQECMAELLGFKAYYMDHTEELIKILDGLNITTDYNTIRKIIFEDDFLHTMKDRWGISLEDTSMIIDNALSPIQTKIILLLRKTKYKKMAMSKLYNNVKNQMDYSRKITAIALAFLEENNKVDISIEGSRKLVILKEIL